MQTFSGCPGNAPLGNSGAWTMAKASLCAINGCGLDPPPHSARRSRSALSLAPHRRSFLGQAVLGEGRTATSHYFDSNVSLVDKLVRLPRLFLLQVARHPDSAEWVVANQAARCSYFDLQCRPQPGSSRWQHQDHLWLPIPHPRVPAPLFSRRQKQASLQPGIHRH